MDAHAELRSDSGGQAGEQVDLDVRHESHLDAAHVRVRDADAGANDPGAEAELGAGDLQLIAETTDQPSGSVTAAVRGRLPGRHPPSLAGTSCLTIIGKLQAARSWNVMEVPINEGDAADSLWDRFDAREVAFGT